MGHMVAEMFRSLVEDFGPAMKKGVQKFADTIGKAADVAESNVDAITKTDSDGAKLFDGLPGDTDAVRSPGEPGGPPGSDGGRVPGDGPSAPGTTEPGAAGRDLPKVPKEGDPVDVATGDVVLGQTDVTLPGALPLVIERAHRSGYRTGRWLGPSWVSTLDQRLEVTEGGVFFAGPDGSVLSYRTRAPAESRYGRSPVPAGRWPATETPTRSGIRRPGRCAGSSPAPATTCRSAAPVSCRWCR